MTAIVDYGVGNLFSLRSSLAFLGLESRVSGDEKELEEADRIILPGVGAFGDAMARLQAAGLVKALRRIAGTGKPLLGVCLGMQLLFDESSEFGRHGGLGLMKGKVLPLEKQLAAMGKTGLKLPHIGWNPLKIIAGGCPLLKNTADGDCFYYVHSYYAACPAENVAAVSEYGVCVPGVVQRRNVFGAQFHPEKSGEGGLGLLRAFAEVKRC